MVPDFDDIVFERLNKDYGAYTLRKRYVYVLGISIVLTIILVSAFVIIPFLIIPDQKNDEIYTSRYLMIENLLPPDEHGGISPPPAPSLPRLAKAIAKQSNPELEYIAPVVVDTLISVEKQITSSIDSMKNGEESNGVNSGEESENGALSGSSSGTGEGGAGGDGTGNGLYSKVDIMPSFKGGDINKFREWVQKKTKYPQTATANNIQGKVYITFVIEKDGSISNVKVARGVDPLIDDEALKSVMSSPRWSPGMIKGKAVRVSYYITVNFEL